MATDPAIELEELERAIRLGISNVRHADGRQVQYRSLADMVATADRIRRAISGQPSALGARYVQTDKALG